MTSKADARKPAHANDRVGRSLPTRARGGVVQGKRSLTSMIHARHDTRAQQPEPPDPGAKAAQMKWAAETANWMDLAMRPDLHQPPAQRAATDAAPAAGLPQDGAGKAMPAIVQAKMEDAFATDFSSVKIHEGPRSAALGARAFTQGADIHFAAGQYQPDTESGQALLGHELTHVVQQSQGRVGATTQMKGVGVNDDAALEREADVMGARAARGEPVSAAVGATGAGRSSSVQRAADTVVQRDPEPEPTPTALAARKSDFTWTQMTFDLNQAIVEMGAGELGAQGLLADCWAVSSIVALGYRDPSLLERAVEQDPDHEHLLKVTLHPMNEGTGRALAPSGDAPRTIEITTKLPTYQTGRGRVLAYGGKGSRAQFAKLIGLLEKAIAIDAGGGQYENIQSNSPRRALGMLTGEATESLDLEIAASVGDLRRVARKWDRIVMVANTHRHECLNPYWSKDEIYGGDRPRPVRQNSLRNSYLFPRKYEPHALVPLAMTDNDMTFYDQGLNYRFSLTFDEMVAKQAHEQPLDPGNRGKFRFKWMVNELVWINNAGPASEGPGAAE